MSDDETQASPGDPPEGDSHPGRLADSAPEPGQLLSHLARLRRQARAARHGYWFPLVIFGLLTLVAIPLYSAAGPVGWSGYSPVVHVAYYPLGRAIPLGPSMFAPLAFVIEWYWPFALALGFLLTVLWYRWHASQTGVETRAHGYLVTGLVLTVAATVLPVLLFRPPLPGWPFLPNLWLTGTVAFLIIAVGLWVLAWAERSKGLAFIALGYTAVTLLIGAFNVRAAPYGLGPALGFGRPVGFSPVLRPGYPLVLMLPAMVLLVAGLASFFVQETRKPA
jgi:hypothetical protein